MTIQEDEFLKNNESDNKVPVTIFLISGIKLQGIIEGIDEKTIILRRQGHRQLVYKHAIATMMPSTATEK